MKKEREPKHLYFAYGSNLNMGQMRYRCPDARPMGQAVLEGYELEFLGTSSGYGVANVARAKKGKVVGGLWMVSDRDLKALDIYEGYPRLYTREELPVKRGKTTASAITYTMTAGHVPATPSEGYRLIIEQGYRDFNIGVRAFRKALAAALQKIYKGGYEHGGYVQRI